MSGDMSEKPAAAAIPPKFSSHVAVLRAMLEPGAGGGLSLVGRRVVVGGWVKSSKEVKKESPAPPEPQVAAPDALATRDVSCSEILQSRIPFIRTIIKILGGNSGSVRDKLESVVAARHPVLLPSTAFLQISDGSCTSSLLVVVESSFAPVTRLLATGTCIVAEGVVRASENQAKHAIELRVEKLLHVGTVESERYPLSKKRLPLNSLRDFPHLRTRTTTVATVMRIRSGLSTAVHAFSEAQGFLIVQLPVADSGQRSNTARKQELAAKMADYTAGVSLEAMRAAVKEKSRIIEELRRSESNKEALVAATRDLHKTSELASRLEAGREAPSLSPGKSRLAGSPQLLLESFACSMGNVCAFGPALSAPDQLESPKHVSEMWTVQMEMAFSELQDSMNCAEEFMRFLCKWVLEKCSEDMKFVEKRMDRVSVDRIQSVISSPIERLTYNEALDALHNKATDSKKSKDIKLDRGATLTTEHLSYLVDEVYKRPVIIYNYPKQAKPFSARLNDDKQTVAAFDLFVPRVGVLISGSQKEERLNMLSARIKELGIASEDYEWYLDLRRHGTAKHAGFSLAFDLMVLFATGLVDVRDVIPFPSFGGKSHN